MRHVESLRESVIGMLLKVIRSLVTVGGMVPPPLTQESSAAGPSGQSAQPMDTDGPSVPGPSSGRGAALDLFGLSTSKRTTNRLQTASPLTDWGGCPKLENSVRCSVSKRFNSGWGTLLTVRGLTVYLEERIKPFSNTLLSTECCGHKSGRFTRQVEPMAWVWKGSAPCFRQ